MNSVRCSYKPAKGGSQTQSDRFSSKISTTRNRGNCEWIATWGRPRHASPSPLRRHAKFQVAEPIHCRIIAFLLLSLLYAVTLTFDIWPWTFAERIACDVVKLCTKFERNRAIRGGVIAISVFDLMTLNNALRVALGSGIIFTKFDLR